MLAAFISLQILVANAKFLPKTDDSIPATCRLHQTLGQVPQLKSSWPLRTQVSTPKHKHVLSKYPYLGCLRFPGLVAVTPTRSIVQKDGVGVSTHVSFETPSSSSRCIITIFITTDQLLQPVLWAGLWSFFGFKLTFYIFSHCVLCLCLVFLFVIRDFLLFSCTFCVSYIFFCLSSEYHHCDNFHSSNTIAKLSSEVAYRTPVSMEASYKRRRV